MQKPVSSVTRFIQLSQPEPICLYVTTTMAPNLRITMKSFVFTIAATISFGLASTTEWPLLRCSSSDPNVDNCMLKAALISANKVFNGLPHVKLPTLEPMKLGDKVLKTGSGPVSLEVDLKNAVLTGVSNVRIDAAKYHKDSHRLELEAFHKDIKLTARYTMKGKILYVPVNSAGTTVISFKDVRAQHAFQFTPRQGKQSLHTQPKQKTVVHTIPNMKSLSAMQMNITSNNLGATGTRILNNLLNSNWRALYDSFKPSIEEWLEDVYTQTMDSFFGSFDYDQMFPDHLRA